jgi:hypothetical protein
MQNSVTSIFCFIRFKNIEEGGRKTRKEGTEKKEETDKERKTETKEGIKK